MATEEHRDVIIERSSGSGMVAIISILIIALVAVGAFALIRSDNNKDSAIATAAHQVGDAAEKTGDVVQDAARKAP